jgi:hypothetical protein
MAQTSDDSENNPLNISSGIRDAVKQPLAYMVLILGFLLGIIFIGAMAWGRFGNDAQRFIFSFLDPVDLKDAYNKNGELSKDIESLSTENELANETITQLQQQLYIAKRQIADDEAKLPKDMVPVTINATALEYDKFTNFLRVNMLIRNISPGPVEFVFGPKLPRLEVRAEYVTDTIDDSASGICTQEQNCFQDTPLGATLHRSLLLQPNASVSVDYRFDMSQDPVRFDLATLKNPDQARISLLLRISSGLRTELRIPLTL